MSTPSEQRLRSNSCSLDYLDIVPKSHLVKDLSTLNLIYDLCRALDEVGVVYCHWKSNAALDRSAKGDNDLDFLISRADVQCFTEILYGLGFKEVQVPLAKQLPGILHYYGYDRESSKLVHVHAHYQLVLGHDMTKNYHLPIEEPYLASTVQGKLFKVPAVEFELIVFVIRMVLKHSTWDAMLSRQGTLSVSEKQELDFLQNRADQTKVQKILIQHLSYVKADLFDECLRSLHPGFPIGGRIKVGHQLQRRLKAQARRSQLQDIYLKPWRRVTKSVHRRIVKRLPKKRLAHGGALIALVGGDGAGKSTAVNGLYSWLANDFDTIKVHMGRPQWSWSTYAVRGTLKIGGWLGKIRHGKRQFQATGGDNHAQEFPGYAWMLRQVFTARDRYQTYIKARRYATNGGLVICDRYPLQRIKLMDGPQITQMIINGPTNKLINCLALIENRYYQQMMPPDKLIVLKVAPAVAVHRKVNENATAVQRRCQEIWDVDWQHTHAHVVDAGQPQPKVLSELRSLVWLEL